MVNLSSKVDPVIWSYDTGQWIPCFVRCQLTITWMSNIKEGHYKLRLHVSFNLLAGTWATLPLCVLFGTQQRIASATLSDGPFSLFLGDKPINQAHYKYLGVLIDANLNFKQHVDKLLVKISKRIDVLGRIRNNLTVDAANKVYQSLVLPVMDYCEVAWSSIGKTERDKLDRAQRRAAKIVLKTNDSNAETDLKWLPLFYEV